MAAAAFLLEADPKRVGNSYKGKAKRIEIHTEDVTRCYYYYYDCYYYYDYYYYYYYDYFT